MAPDCIALTTSHDFKNAEHVVVDVMRPRRIARNERLVFRICLCGSSNAASSFGAAHFSIRFVVNLRRHDEIDTENEIADEHSSNRSRMPLIRLFSGSAEAKESSTQPE